MLRFIERLFGIDREERVHRLNRLAVEMDQLLIGGMLTPDVRLQLEEARQRLEEQIRQLMAA